MTEQLYGDDAGEVRRPPRALVVDDNVAIRTLMARLLALQGYFVLQSENGAEALDVLRAGPDAVDLVVTDVWMPEMGGGHFARHVWRAHPGMPIVFVSGQEPDDGVQALLSGGNSAFLAKPFSREALEIAIACVRDAAVTQGPTPDRDRP